MVSFTNPLFRSEPKIVEKREYSIPFNTEYTLLYYYRESIEHFLVCLQQQPQSEAVWQGLRMALTLSKSYNELINVDQRNLDTLLVNFNVAN